MKLPAGDKTQAMEKSPHPAPPSYLSCRPLQNIGGGDGAFIYLREIIKLKRIFQILLQAAHGLRILSLILLDDELGRSLSASSIRLKQDLFQLLGQTSLFAMRNLGQDVSHKMYLAPLPTCPYPLFLYGCLSPLMSIRNKHPHPPYPPPLKLPHKLLPRLLFLFPQRLRRQYLPPPLFIHPISYHYRQRHYPPIATNLLIKSIHPDKRILPL